MDSVIVKSTPAEMILAALTGGADLDKVEKLLEIQIKWEANEARKVFAASFANAQRDIGSVVKNKTNNQTKSKYADLADVIDVAKPVYTKEGFSVIFYEGETTKTEHIRIYADVLHSAGHKETYYLDVPMDGKGLQGNANMTKIHGMASSVAYGRRYLMCMIWNIPTSDNDGNTMDAELITKQQVVTLLDLINTKELKQGPLLTYMKVEKLENIKAADYMKCLAAINAAPNKNK